MNSGFASTPEVWIDAERNAAVRRALDLIVAGRRLSAYEVLLASVTRQARVAGIRLETPL